MKLSIMQPYIFPYLGYFQMIGSCNKFVVYDDVNFIKQGWINRNRILLNGKDFLFSVPLKDASSFKQINQTEINKPKYAVWVVKFLSTIKQAYHKAPEYSHVFPLLESVMSQDYDTIDQLARESIINTCKFIGIETAIKFSSGIYPNKALKGQSRILDICRIESANIYINPSGGQELYSKSDFKEKGIDLFFIAPELKEYRQNAPSFVSGLSIIDVLMFNSLPEVKEMLNSYRLI